MSHLRAAEQQTGKRLTNLPHLEPHLLQVWHLFMDISMGRQISQAGLQPILWSEFEAFGRLRGVPMTPALVFLFRRLEQVLLRFSAEQMKKSLKDTNSERDSNG